MPLSHVLVSGDGEKSGLGVQIIIILEILDEAMGMNEIA